MGADCGLGDKALEFEAGGFPDVGHADPLSMNARPFKGDATV